MALHDAYLRRTPYEIAFGNRDRVVSLLERIDEEAAGRGADPGDPHQFVTMGAVATFLRELQGPDAPSGAVHSYGALTFHGVHLTRAGCPTYVMSAHVARYLVEGAPSGSPVAPAPAGYLQLPQHLFWSATVAGAPESVDGVFWTLSGALLHSMLVTGLRPDRPGLGVVPLPEVPFADAAGWLRADVRGDGSDFASSLPGSEIDRLYQFDAAGEVLKLLGRFFAYVASFPKALVVHPAGGGGGAGGGEGPPRHNSPSSE